MFIQHYSYLSFTLCLHYSCPIILHCVCVSLSEPAISFSAAALSGTHKVAIIEWGSRHIASEYCWKCNTGKRHCDGNARHENKWETVPDKRQQPTKANDWSTDRSTISVWFFRLSSNSNFFCCFTLVWTDNQRVPSGSAVAVEWRTGGLRVHQRATQGGRHSAWVSQDQS